MNLIMIFLFHEENLLFNGLKIQINNENPFLKGRDF